MSWWGLSRRPLRWGGDLITRRMPSYFFWEVLWVGMFWFVLYWGAVLWWRVGGLGGGVCGGGSVFYSGVFLRVLSWYILWKGVNVLLISSHEMHDWVVNYYC